VCGDRGKDERASPNMLQARVATIREYRGRRKKASIKEGRGREIREGKVRDRGE